MTAPPLDRDPLVVTLRLEEAAQQRFDEERSALFPPGRTQVGAHVTLFHAVPGRHEDAAVHDVRDAARRPPLPVHVTGLVSLGRGVAYRLESPALTALHRDLQRRWTPWLTRQDSQPLRAHVTVQNKVVPDEARATLQRLSSGFTPYTVAATGLQVWHYRGGPWEPLVEVSFHPPSGERS